MKTFYSEYPDDLEFVQLVAQLVRILKVKLLSLKCYKYDMWSKFSTAKHYTS